jgi:ribosomal protein S18 acetylase RimI-like enzyme
MSPERGCRGVFSVRDAVPDDLTGVQTVARAAWHAAYDDHLGAGTVDRVVDDWYAPSRLGGEVAAAPFVVAERDGGRLVGFASGRRRTADEATLSRLYVHPDDWGRGVGTALLRATTKRVRAATTLRAVVLARNAVGRAFYDRHGFTLRARRRTRLKGRRFEVVVLVAPLAPLRRLPAVEGSAVPAGTGENTGAGDDADVRAGDDVDACEGVDGSPGSDAGDARRPDDGRTPD